MVVSSVVEELWQGVLAQIRGLSEYLTNAPNKLHFDSVVSQFLAVPDAHCYLRVNGRRRA